MEALAALVVVVGVLLLRRPPGLCWGCGRPLRPRLRRYRHFHDQTCRKYLRLVHRATERVERHRAETVPQQRATSPADGSGWSAPG